MVTMAENHLESHEKEHAFETVAAAVHVVSEE